MLRRARDLWSCPECGRRFTNRNQWHSCITVTVEDHFRERPPEVRELFDRLLAVVEDNGPVTINPVKTRISFQVRMNFASVTPRKRGLRVQFVLARRIESERFISVMSPSPRNHVYEVAVTSPEDLDAEFRGWMAKAYRVERQEHVEERE